MQARGSNHSDSHVQAHASVRVTLERIFRGYLRPGLDSFGKTAKPQTTEWTSILDSLLGIRTETFAGFRAEFDQVIRNLDLSRTEDCRYPENWRMESPHALLLYAMVRAKHPRVVVETGVADGYSSSVILAALQENREGRLVSFDIGTDVGALVPTGFKKSWELSVLPHRGRADALRRALDALPYLDLFLHDSSHTYDRQLFEYRSAWRNMDPGGIMVSDDADSSFAFLDFARSVGMAFGVLVGSRKVLGIGLKSTSRAHPVATLLKESTTSQQS